MIIKEKHLLEIVKASFYHKKQEANTHWRKELECTVSQHVLKATVVSVQQLLPLVYELCPL